jgi:hypothetical protein
MVLKFFHIVMVVQLGYSGFDNFGTGSIRLLETDDGYCSAGTCENFTFSQKKVDNISITRSPTSTTIESDVELILTANLNGQNTDEFQQVFSWSLWEGGELIQRFSEQGSTLTITPGEYYGQYSERKQLTFRVEFRACIDHSQITPVITLNPPKPYIPSGGYNVTDENCANAEDGSFRLTRINLNGRLYSGETTLPETLTIYVQNTSPNGTSPGSFEFNRLPFEVPNIPPGSYSFNVEQSNGNSTIRHYFSVDNAIPISITSEILTQITCNGGTGEIRVTTNGGEGDFNFSFDKSSWHEPSSISGNNYIYEFSNLSSSNYTFYVRDANLCIDSTESIPLLEPERLSLNSTNLNPTTTCVGNGRIEVQNSGGSSTGDLTFQLQRYNVETDDLENYGDPETRTAGTAQTVIFNTLPEGIYQVSVEDNCPYPSDTLDTRIVFDSLARPENLDYELISALCHNGQGDLLINSFDYEGSQIDDNTTLGNNYRIKLWQPGLDTSFNYSRLTLPFYVKENGNFGGFNGNSTYNLSVVYNSTGCPSDSIEITIPHPSNPIKVNQNNIQANCENDSITLVANVTGGTPYSDPNSAYRYKWSYAGDYLSDTTSLIKVWEAGTYLLEVVDSVKCGLGFTVPNGISQTEPFTVSRPKELVLIVENATDSDGPGKNNGSVTLGTKYNVPSAKYSMDNTSFQVEPFFGGLSPDTYTFYVLNENGCITSIDTTIGEAPAFEVRLDSTKNVSCYGGASGKIFMNATGGIPPYTFEITGNNGFSQKQTDNPVFTDLPEGSYSIFVSFTGADTYTDTIDNILITQPTQLTANITGFTNAVCNQEIGSATVTASGGTPDYTYQWAGPVNSQTSQTANNLRAGIHIVTVTDANDCTAETSIQLFDPAGPVLAQIGSTTAPCSDSENGGSATLEVTGGTPDYSIEWEDIGVTGLVAENIAPGLYTASVTDATGCKYTLDNIVVPAPEELFATLTDFKDPACYSDANGEITVAGNGGTAPYQYQWQNIEGNPTTATVTGLEAGTYEVLITDDHNCTSTESFPLNNPMEIIINLPDSVFICQGQTATLDAGNMGALFEWVADNGFTSDQQIINVQEQGDYLVQVSNVEGCSNTAKTYVKFENRQFYATFLMSGEATMNDTIIVIELSRPQPDEIEWFIPDDFMKLVDGESYKELIPLQTGDFTIGMKAGLSGCSEMVEKRITIVPADNSVKEKTVADALIQSARLFPNPNTGQFEVEVKLAKETDISADVFSMKGMRMMPTKYDYGKKRISTGL